MTYGIVCFRFKYMTYGIVCFIKVSVNSEKKILLDIVSEIYVVMLCELCYFG